MKIVRAAIAAATAASVEGKKGKGKSLNFSRLTFHFELLVRAHICTTIITTTAADVQPHFARLRQQVYFVNFFAALT